MFCGKCGETLPDNAIVCSRCGAQVARVATTGYGESIPNYLVGAILVTLFCCLPLGIPAIVFATQVNSKVAIGDIEGAKKASKNAMIWTFVSLGAGLVGGLIYILFMVIMAASGNL